MISAAARQLIAQRAFAPGPRIEARPLREFTNVGFRSQTKSPRLAVVGGL